MLEINRISKSYPRPEGAVRALAKVSLRAGPGEFVVVRGPSGCGKTTLLLAAGGLLAVDEGQVKVEGQDVYALSAGQRAALRAQRIGFVFQQFHLIPYLSVRDNIMLPVLVRQEREAWQRTQALMERLQLAERARHVPAELSTGERQRVALARALLNRPKLLLADEPTGNLDDDSAQTVFDCLTEFARAGGAVVAVTHSMTLAQGSGRVVYMHQGQIAEGRTKSR